MGPLQRLLMVAGYLLMVNDYLWSYQDIGNTLMSGHR